jgi:hypothetical protein
MEKAALLSEQILARRPQSGCSRLLQVDELVFRGYGAGRLFFARDEEPRFLRPVSPHKWPFNQNKEP